MEIKTKEDFDNLKGYYLSDKDITDAIDIEPTNIFTLDKVEGAYSIDELLDRLGRGVLFFKTANDNTGHWIGVLKQGGGVVEVYDPYGFKPDDLEDKLGALKGLNPDISVLEDLIKRSGYRMIYNRQKNQSMSRDVATCGRHSVMRLMFRHLNNKQFNDFLKQIRKEDGINPDDLATGLTMEIIGK